MKKRSTKKKSKFRDAVVRNSKKQKSQGSQFGYLKLPKNINIFKESVGRISLDILPYVVKDPRHPDRDEDLEIAVPGSLWYKRPFKIHRSIGPEETTVICPTSVGKKCPICDYAIKLKREGADPEELRALKPSRRNLYYVVPINHKEYDEKPHIWDISQYLFQDKLNEEITEDEDLAVFPDLEEGLTLRLRFSESHFGKNTFAEISRIDFVEREGSYDEEDIEKLPSLDDVLDIKSYDELESLFFGFETDAEEESEEEEEPEEVNFRKRKRKIVEEEEEEDEPPFEEDEQEEPEEEEERPRRRKSGKRKKSSKNKCPFGHEFGVDTDEYDDCDECDIWEQCMEEFEKRK